MLHSRFPGSLTASIATAHGHSLGTNVGTSLLNCILYSNFISFYPDLLFLFQDLIRVTTLKRHVSSTSFGLWQLPILSLFFMAVAVLRSTGQFELSLRDPTLYWDASNFFLVIGLRLCVLGRNSTEVNCHFYYIVPRVRVINVTHRC